MPVDLTALGIDRMSVDERLELIDAIWETMPEQMAPSEIPEWHFEVLARRREEAERNPGVGRPWREVLGKLDPPS